MAASPAGVVLGQPVRDADRAFALDRAQETVDRLPGSWVEYLAFVAAPLGALAGVVPVDRAPTWMLVLAVVGTALYLLFLAVALRVQWWHRKNRAVDADG